MITGIPCQIQHLQLNLVLMVTLSKTMLHCVYLIEKSSATLRLTQLNESMF